MLLAENISKKYKKVIFNNVSFSAEVGDFIMVVGENGSGKSTLLSILAGVLKPEGGELYWDKERLFKKRKLFKKYIGFVPQENPLIEEVSVLDNLKLWYYEDKKGLNKAIESGVIKRFGVNEFLKKKVKTLSGGMKKRLSIACAVADNPPVLVLDEPTASLDIVCKAEVREYLKEYAKNGGIVIMTTHETDDLKLANKVFLMKNGAFSDVSDGFSPERLLELIKK